MNTIVIAAAMPDTGEVPGTTLALPPLNPFVGPVPLEVGQKLHGRRRETDELSDLLVSKRVVVLFSPSGAGKTSLIRAGLIPKLENAYGMEALPIVRLGYRDPECDRDASVNRYRLAMLLALEKLRDERARRPACELRAYTLKQYFEECVSAAIGRNSRGDPHYPLLILDQFEELFTADPLDVHQKREFLEELGSLLRGGDTGVAIWALFAIREDHLAELQPYLDLFPTALAFRCRLEALGVDAAREAIGGTAGSDWMEPDVPQRLVDDLRRVSVRGADGRETYQPGRFVEPVQLQVACRGLWEKIVARQGRRIESDDVQSQDHSEVDRALRDFFDEGVAAAAIGAGVSERRLREWIESELISASGVRTQTLRDVSLLGRMDDAITRLVDAHLLRCDTRDGHDWIELPHDRLVAPIRAANKAWTLEHLQPFQKQAAYWHQATGEHARHLLLAEDELATARTYAERHAGDVTREEIEYLDASQQEIVRNAEEVARDRRERRRRIAMASIFATVILTLLVTSIFVERWQKAQAAGRSKLYQEVGETTEKVSTSEALMALLALRPRAIAADKTGMLSHFVDNEIRKRLAHSPAAIVGELQPRKHIVRSLAFTSNGDHLLAGSWDGHISVQDVAPDGATAWETNDLQTETYAVAVDGARGLVASTHGDGRALLWRLNGRELQSIAMLIPGQNHSRRLTSAGFSSDGRWLAVAGWGKKVDVWDLANPHAPAHAASFHVSGAPIMSIAFLPGKDEARRLRLATADYDGVIRLWPIGDGVPKHPKPLREFSIRDHEGRDVGISASAVDPSGRYFVAGDTEGFLHVWDLASDDRTTNGILLNRATYGAGSRDTSVQGIAFAPQLNEFVTVGVDGYVVRWTLPVDTSDLSHLVRGTTEQRFRIGERLYSVAYRPHQPGQIAVGGTHSILLLDLRRGTGPALSSPLPTSSGQAPWQAVSMDAEGTRIAARDRDGQIHVWLRDKQGSDEQGNIREVYEWKLEAGSSAFALSPDGQRLITADCRGWPTEWSLRIGTRPEFVHASTAEVPGDCPSRPPAMPSISPDGRLLATTGDNILRIWTRESSAAHAWSESSSSSLPRSDVAKANASNQDPIVVMAFSPDSHYLVVGADSGDVRLLKENESPSTGQFARVEDVDVGQRVSALTFNQNGKALRVGSVDGILTELSVPNLVVVGNPAFRHEWSITGAANAWPKRRTDRSVLVTADSAGNVVEWAGPNSAHMRTIDLTGGSSSPVSAIALNRDGTFLVTAGQDLLGWNLAPDHVLAAAEAYAKRSYREPNARPVPATK